MDLHLVNVLSTIAFPMDTAMYVVKYLDMPKDVVLHQPLQFVTVTPRLRELKISQQEKLHSV